MTDVLMNPELSGGNRSAGVRAAYRGAEGVKALSGALHFDVEAMDRYRADYLSVDYGGVTFERFRSSPCRITQRDQPSGAVDSISLTLVTEGELRCAHDGLAYAAAVGDLLVARTTKSFELRSSGTFQAVRLLVPASRVPPRLLDADAGPRGPLAPTRLTSSVGAFLQRLAAGPASAAGPDRVYLSRAVAELAIAVLIEAAGEEIADDPVAALRLRVRDYIDRNLADPALGPQRIAEALGVSVRYVHRVFNTGDETVAKHIRERRLDAVAEVLRSERQPQRVGDLAARYGFSGRDHLTRAFRQRFGRTVREYQETVWSEPGLVGTPS